MCGPLPQADVVVMELGILHYFVDLQALLGKGEGEGYIRNSIFSEGCNWGGGLPPGVDDKPPPRVVPLHECRS